MKKQYIIQGSIWKTTSRPYLRLELPLQLQSQKLPVGHGLFGSGIPGYFLMYLGFDSLPNPKLLQMDIELFTSF